MPFEAAAALIGLREGLEAMLVTGILLGMVRRLGHGGHVGTILGGAAAGLVAAVLFGLAVQAGLAPWYSGANTAVAELLTGLVALGILVYMVVWMYRHTMQTVAGVHARVLRAIEGGRWLMLASLAFVVVLREGIEMVLFFAARAAQTPWSVLAWSGAAGFAVSALVAGLVFAMSVRINLERFFAVTGLLLILLGAGILVGATGAGEEVAEEHHWFSATPAAYDLSESFPHEDHCRNETVDADACAAADTVHANPLAAVLHTLVGYEDHPSWAQVVAYVAFLGGFGGWYATSLARKHPASLARPPTPPTPPAPPT